MRLPDFTAIPTCVFSAAVLAVFALDHAVALPRLWTATDGRQLIGEFVKADANTVTINRDTGKPVSIPIAMLTPEDREFATKEQKAKASSDKEAASKKEAEWQSARSAPEKEEKGKGHITYKLSNGSEKWPEDRRKRIVAAMDEAIKFLNEHGDFTKEVTANNSPGTPTADANIGGWINWGGSISRRVAIHEIAHTLGIGTGENWGKNIENGLWTGKFALEQLRAFDGKDAVLHADRQHFWPYGLNQDSESSPENDLRHIKIVEAMRKDMGMK